MRLLSITAAAAMIITTIAALIATYVVVGVALVGGIADVGDGVVPCVGGEVGAVVCPGGVGFTAGVAAVASVTTNEVPAWLSQ